MRLGERFKIWLGIKEKEIFKLDDTEILKKKLNDCRKNYNNINNNYLRLKGETITLEEEISYQNGLLKRVLEDAKLCKDKGLLDEIPTLFEQKKALEKDIQVNKNKIESYEKIIEQYNKTRLSLKKTMNDLETSLEECKAQEELANATDELLDVVKGIEVDDSIKDLKKSVTSKFNTAELKLQQFTEENKTTSDKLEELRYEDELSKFMDDLA